LFSYLNSGEAKIRLIKTILMQDDLDSWEYKTPDHGPDADGDGAVETTLKNGNVYNELGEIVDETRQAWVSMNSKMDPSQDNIWSDKVELSSFNINEIYRVSTLIIKSGYLSEEQVLGAISDAKSLPIDFNFHDFLDSIKN
jgi:hypothetical protein